MTDNSKLSSAEEAMWWVNNYDSCAYDKCYKYIEQECYGSDPYWQDVLSIIAKSN